MEDSGTVMLVACNKQVYIGWLEATVLSVYLPEEKRKSMYVHSTFLVSLPPLPPGPCPTRPFSYPCVAEPVRTDE